MSSLFLHLHLKLPERRKKDQTEARSQTGVDVKEEKCAPTNTRSIDENLNSKIDTNTVTNNKRRGGREKDK